MLLGTAAASADAEGCARAPAGGRFPTVVAMVAVVLAEGCADADADADGAALPASSRAVSRWSFLPHTIKITITTSAAAAIRFWRRCACLRMMMDGRAG